MDGTDPRWTWWTDAMETVAQRLERLKRPKPGENWHTVDRRLAKWLGRLHQSGLWLGLKAPQTARLEAIIRTNIDADRAREELVVTTTYNPDTERCGWWVHLRTDPPGPDGETPTGSDKTRARTAARAIAVRAIEASRNEDVSTAWEGYADYFKNPAETMNCKKRLVEAIRTAEHWAASGAPITELQAAMNATHAVLEPRRHGLDRLTRTTIGVPIVAPYPRARVRTDTDRAEITIAGRGDGQWRLDTEGAGRLIEAAIQADRNSRMTLPRVVKVLEMIAAHPEMQRNPEGSLPSPAMWTTPTTTTPWIRAHGQLTRKERDGR